MKILCKRLSVLLLAGAVTVPLTTVGFAEEFQYVGNKKCVGCHRNEYKAWQEDYHSRALDDLRPGVKAEIKEKAGLDPHMDYTADASCLACHNTGYGKAADPGAELSDVGCESCHGPGSKYRNVKIMNKKKYAEDREAQHALAVEAGLSAPTEALCVECHNEKSPTWKGFDYATMIEEVKHRKQE